MEHEGPDPGSRTERLRRALGVPQDSKRSSLHTAPCPLPQSHASVDSSPPWQLCAKLFSRAQSVTTPHQLENSNGFLSSEEKTNNVLWPTRLLHNQDSVYQMARCLDTCPFASVLCSVYHSPNSVSISLRCTGSLVCRGSCTLAASRKGFHTFWPP